jgi:hypothetical protein
MVLPVIKNPSQFRDVLKPQRRQGREGGTKDFFDLIEI